ncbi:MULTISPECIES: ABC transporter substrate-binding protein [Methanosarcina]|uniref:Iron ABC transporter substrate-binding protein n=3 Tax=Methanosarcina barkeri TaxID=2208 RepID=A0A0G3C812_METBA|nr:MULTISPECIES: ABC transporter substrate-binding protein [Methanosarcina]AKJ38116.1 iron ABC transporter substrate-binding protein [Methanosarcina barkeri CM1]OED03303.1 ABC transporter substrate-binding protein [Methanosarcina sp. A14]
MRTTKRQLSLFIVLCLLITLSILLVSGCSQKTNDVMDTTSNPKTEITAATNIEQETTMSDTALSGTRVITDLAGRNITLPADITRISVLHPIPCQMVWRLAPEKLVSADKQFTERLEFMSDNEEKRLLALPINGEFHSDMNVEDLLAVSPQVVITLTKDTKIESEQKKVGIPFVAASKDTLEEIADSWRFIGKIVGNEKEGNELGDYWDETIKKVTNQTSKINDSDKLKVYYAQPDVTKTVGSRTIMASIISLAGGISFMEANPQMESANTSEEIQVSLEQIYQWNPDVIITKTAKGRDEILSKDAWKDIAAVKNKRVYASTKYEMLDRTQSLMGLLWTAKVLYPDKVKIDLDKEVKTFYSKVYLDNNVTNDQISQTN